MDKYGLQIFNPRWFISHNICVQIVSIIKDATIDLYICLPTPPSYTDTYRPQQTKSSSSQEQENLVPDVQPQWLRGNNQVLHLQMQKLRELADAAYWSMQSNEWFEFW
jgi:hypothetical protein